MQLNVLASICVYHLFTRRWLVCSWLIGSSLHKQHTQFQGAYRVKSVHNPFFALQATQLPPHLLHFPSSGHVEGASKLHPSMPIKKIEFNLMYFSLNLCYFQSCNFATNTWCPVNTKTTDILNWRLLTLRWKCCSHLSTCYSDLESFTVLLTIVFWISVFCIVLLLLERVRLAMCDCWSCLCIRRWRSFVLILSASRADIWPSRIRNLDPLERCCNEKQTSDSEVMLLCHRTGTSATLHPL